MSLSETADWIIVGGGLAGCVLASRLKEKHPHKSVILLEVGPNEHDNPMVQTPLGCFALPHTPLHYNYRTVPQKHLNGRRLQNTGGKLLSGGSAVNYGAWTRGDAVDYDEWANAVNDQSWSYTEMLPYFRKTESYHVEGPGGLDLTQHGKDGRLHIRSGNRAYGLRDPVRNAYQEIGLRYVHDANGGYPHGFALWTENWHEGKRQPAGVVYPLDKVNVITGACARRVLFDTSTSKPRATGVELTDGRTFKATREVVISCGTYRTPQLLMLSGIGPKDHLSKYSIPQLLDLPVGANLHDHCALTIPVKLRNPEHGYAVGSPNFKDPSFQDGHPMNWGVTESVPKSKMVAALMADGESVTDEHPMLKNRGHYEGLVVYVPAVELDSESEKQMPNPPDGTYISLAALMLLPTSRGTITLSSTSAEDDPVIDPNYLATEADRMALREGTRRMLAAAEAPSLRGYLGDQTPPQGHPQLSSTSSDEDIDARGRATAFTWWHPAGTAAMGSVVDTELRVKGADGLRVCDASIFPLPLAAHYQAAVYATAEKGADIIAAAV